MRLAICLYRGEKYIAREDGNDLILLGTEHGPSIRLALVEQRLQALAEATGRRVPMGAVTFCPPIEDPDKIICVGMNYRGHLAETSADLPQSPSLFVRFPSSQVGHNQPIVAPSVSAQLDYEGELAVIIGRPAWRVSEEEALAYIAGYSCFAENSVRDYQSHARQVTAGKNFLASGAFGPWLTTSDDVGDPTDLELITRLNGQVVQRDLVSSLIFSVPRLISYITEFTRLLPGDVISTGTPDGVGFLRNPPVYLTPGDRMEVEIPGVGLLQNLVEAEQDSTARISHD